MGWAVLGARSFGEEYRTVAPDISHDREELSKVTSSGLSKALETPEDLWRFITAPDTPYIDRMAAVSQGSSLFPLEWMPRLMAAIGELRRESRLHSWGVSQPVFSATRFNGLGIELQKINPKTPKEFIVLGHKWNAPTNEIPYPETMQAKERAPWPWQVQNALNELLVYIKPYHTEREKAERWLEAAMQMPCTTDEEAGLFIEASKCSSHVKTIAVMARWHWIALQPEFPNAACAVAMAIGETTRLWNDPFSQSVGQVIITDILRHSPHKNAKERAAYSLPDLRYRWVGVNRERKLPLPATAIVAASERALQLIDGDEWNRLYTYAFSVCETLDRPPVKPDRNMDPDSPMVTRLLKHFESWFADRKDDLLEEQAKEAPQLNNLREQFKSANKNVEHTR
jgi:hypothetical protein